MADLDAIPRLYRGLLHALAIDEGAVGAAEVFEDEAIRADGQKFGVELRDLFVLGQAEVCASAPTDEELLYEIARRAAEDESEVAERIGTRWLPALRRRHLPKRALELTFFPELLDVRTEIGR